MSVQSKLTLGLGAVVGLFVISVVLAYVALTRIAESEQSLFEENFENTYDLVNLRANLNAERLDAFVLADSPQTMWGPWLEDLEERRLANSQILTRLEAQFQHEPNILVRVHELIATRDAFLNTRETEVLPRLRTGQIADAKVFMLGVQMSRHLRIGELAREIELLEIEEASDRAQTGAKQANTSRVWFVSLGSVAILGAIALSFLLRRSVARYVAMENEATDALLANKAKLEAALASMTDAVFISDSQGRLMDFNEAFATFHKFGSKAECAKTLAEFPAFIEVSQANGERMPPEQWPISLALRGETVTSTEYLLRRKDTGEIWVGSCSFAPIRNSQGMVVGAVGTGRDITERKRAEVSLRENEAEFRGIFNQAAVGMAQVDLDGRWLRANQRMCDIVGYSWEELRTMAFQETTHPDDLGANLTFMRQLMADERQTYTMEKRYIRKDQSIVYINLTVSLVREISGVPKYFVAVVEDISERKRAEEVARHSETRYQVLFETLIEGFCTIEVVFDASNGAVDFRFLEVNPAFERLTGLHDVEGKLICEMVPNMEAHWFEAFGRIVLTGKPEHFENEAKALGRFYDVSAYRVGGPESRKVAILFNDITERKIAERRLHEQNEILSNSHEGVMIVSRNNRVTLWNHGAEVIFGWTQAEALNRLPEELLGVDDLDAIALMRAAVEKEGFRNGEMPARTRDGRKLIVESHTTLVRDKAGIPLGRLTFFSDVTEKKLLEKKFLHAQRLESIGMLAAGIAHDLNNMLAPIVFAAPLLRASLDAEQDLKILSTIEASAGRGAGLVKQILGFVNRTAGEFQPTQVKHLVRDVIGLIEETFPKTIKLEHAIPSDLWLVHGNPTQIHQVFLNLCVNARDAMPLGGTLRITMSNRILDEQQAAAFPGGLPGSWVTIEVADTGTGIAPDVLAHIWDPFFTTKGPGKGTGLGLSTVRGIVASHRGFVILDTQLGQGTAFRVFLPATKEKIEGVGNDLRARAFDGHGKLVLVVDDNSTIREGMVGVLAKHHYRVLSAVDGLEAINRYGSSLADLALVITDWDMPHLGGEILARVISRLRPELPMLITCGLSFSTEEEEQEFEEMKKLGHLFLLKPFSSESLLESAQTLLNQTAILIPQ